MSASAAAAAAAGAPDSGASNGLWDPRQTRRAQRELWTNRCCYRVRLAASRRVRRHEHQRRGGAALYTTQLSDALDPRPRYLVPLTRHLCNSVRQ